MGDTYDTAIEAEADRAQQPALLAALNATERVLRRDECGAWRINGRNDGAAGSIHTWGDGTTWVLYVRCRSARHWTATKKRLSFCTVTQDGDDEGCLRLLNLPTPNQAAIIRDALGIRKRLEYEPEELERRRASMKRLRQAKSLGSHASQVPDTVGDPEPISEPEPAK